MEEKYRVCDEALQKLLSWVGDVEDKVAHQDVVQEDSEQLRNQINTLKVYISCSSIFYGSAIYFIEA